MADENRFEIEMTRMMNLVISKLDTLETDVSELKSDFKKTDQKIDTLSGQLSDVANLVIKNDKRLTKVEIDIAELQNNVH